MFVKTFFKMFLVEKLFFGENPADSCIIEVGLRLNCSRVTG